MKRILILLIAVMACQAATGLAPASAFPPFPPGVSLNTNYWTGWITGETTPILIPDSSYPDWWTYYAAVKQNWLPRYHLNLPFFPINYNDGFDDAEEVAANWFWRNTPDSCAVIACNSANARKRVKPPMMHKHLDLVGKGVDGVIKIVYRGARVIL